MSKALALFMLAFLFPALAQPIAPTEANLRTAIQAGGTITFSSPGTIPISQVIEITNTVTIDGAAQSIIIDGQNSTTLFKVISGASLTLRNLTLANGRNKGANGLTSGQPGLPGTGGAIQNFAGAVSSENCIFTNNAAIGGNAFLDSFSPFLTGLGGDALGGAIYQVGGYLNVSASSFLSNTVLRGAGNGGGFGGGGAIFANGGTVTITNVTFATNSASGGATWATASGGDGTGGAIHAQNAVLTIHHSTFSANQAVGVARADGRGGAIFATNGNFSITDSLLANNKAFGGKGVSYRGSLDLGKPGRGGAIYLGPGAISTIQSSAFIENQTLGSMDATPFSPSGSTSYGGALFNAGTTTLLNSTFAGNVASHYLPASEAFGGAIYNQSALNISFVTIASNTCNGPIVASDPTAPDLKAIILGPNNGINFTGPFTDSGFNLSSDTTPAFTQSTSVNGIDVYLGPLGNYGGATPTFPILAGSPAINRVTSGAFPTVDQRGRNRPAGVAADAGAYESSAPFFIIGMLEGRVPAGTTITRTTTTFAPDADNQFYISNLPAGDTTITVSGPNTLFRPSPLTVNVDADMIIPFQGFTFQEFAWDPEWPWMLTYAFAGRANETWDFYASNDLVQWQKLSDRQFTDPAIAKIEVTNLPKPVFLKAIRR